MVRKFIALLLTICMVASMFVGCSNSQESFAVSSIQAGDLDITVVETQEKREASTTVEGVSLKCEHFFDTDEYLLYLDEEPIELTVTEYDEHIEVFLVNEVNTNYDEQVVGQMVLTLALATPAFIATAKVLLAVAAGYAATVAIYASANAIATVIGEVRTSSQVYKRYRTIDITAADAIRYGRMKKTNTYYSAYLNGNSVMVGGEITLWMAVLRLQNGQDVFATSEFAAIYACTKASTSKNSGKTLIHHMASDEGYYPHYHPLGRHWYKNYNYAPHCWYPYS